MGRYKKMFREALKKRPPSDDPEGDPLAAFTEAREELLEYLRDAKETRCIKSRKEYPTRQPLACTHETKFYIKGIHFKKRTKHKAHPAKSDFRMYLRRHSDGSVTLAFKTSSAKTGAILFRYEKERELTLKPVWDKGFPVIGCKKEEKLENMQKITDFLVHARGRFEESAERITARLKAERIELRA